MTIDDEWRLTSRPEDIAKSDVPRQKGPRYQLDIDGPLFQRADEPANPAAAAVGSLSWSTVTDTDSESTDTRSREAQPSVDDTDVAAIIEQILHTGATTVTQSEPVVEELEAEPEPEPEPEPVAIAATPPPPPPAPAAPGVDTLAALPDAPVSDEVPALVIEVDDPVQTTPDPRSLTLSNHAIYTTQAAPSRAINPAMLMDTPYVAPRRRRKSPLGTLVKLVVLLGVIGGAAFAVKTYVLDTVKWSAELEPAAAQVEKFHGLTFTESLPLVSLPIDEYTARLASTFSRFMDDDWAAFGVAPSGDADEALSRTAVLDRPAFYDAETASIVELAELPDSVSEVARWRALSAALLDQNTDWSTVRAASGHSQSVAIDAVIDGAGRNAAESLLGRSGESAYDRDLFQFASDLPAAADTPSSPYFGAVVGRSGIAAQGVTAGLTGDALVTALQELPADDGVVFDITRDPASSSASTTAKGVLFWYHVLASKMDATSAWRAAVSWADDDVTEVAGTSPACWSAAITSADTFGGDVLQLAFTTWAAGTVPAPVVTRTAPTTVTVQACLDPAVPVVPVTPSTTIGGAPLERALVDMAANGSTPLAADRATCLVQAARASGLAIDGDGNQPPLLGVDGWTPAWATANVPLLSGCPAG